MVEKAVKVLALELLEKCYEDEIAHLKLRIIRDAQQSRFEALKETHPDIYKDFVCAREGPHEVLLWNRRERVKILTSIVEGLVSEETRREK